MIINKEKTIYMQNEYSFIILFNQNQKNAYANKKLNYLFKNIFNN
jgi:hypothetical protein